MADRGRMVNWGHRVTGSGRLLSPRHRLNNRDPRKGDRGFPGFLVHRVAEAVQSPFSASTASVYPRQYSQVT
jgi:hypothetical protein